MKSTVTTQPTMETKSEIRDGKTLLELARGWLKQGNPVVALELLTSAARSAEAEQQPILRAQILKETGRAYMMQSDWDMSGRFYVEAQHLFVDHEDYKGAAESARNHANMCFQQGRYAESQALCEQALRWASIIADHELRATILNTLAAIKSATGDHRAALSNFRLCLADFQASGNVIRQGYVLLNIGLAEMELGEHDAATKDLNESLAIALRERDLQLVEICYQNISKCYLAQKETVLAKSVVETARKILPGLNSVALDTELSLLEGRILRAMGDFAGAAASLEGTLTRASEAQLSALHADTLYEQGLLHRDLGERFAATAKMRAAVDAYKSIGMDKGFRDAVAVLEQLERQATARG